MKDENDHSAFVNAWIERVTEGLPPERLLERFEYAFGALWARAHRTLGDVTLMAIVDRVLYHAAERFPALSALRVEPGGLRCEALRERVSTLMSGDLVEAFRFVLLEFLTVLGNLTAEILTPGLHEELSRVTSEDATIHLPTPGREETES